MVSIYMCAGIPKFGLAIVKEGSVLDNVVPITFATRSVLCRMLTAGVATLPCSGSVESVCHVYYIYNYIIILHLYRFSLVNYLRLQNSGRQLHYIPFSVVTWAVASNAGVFLSSRTLLKISATVYSTKLKTLLNTSNTLHISMYYINFDKCSLLQFHWILP